MKLVDPNYLLDTISLNPECPKDILFLVRWLKAMVLWQDANLEVDREVLVDYFYKCVNSELWPQSTLNIITPKEVVASLYDRAREWLWTKEVF